MRYPPSLWERFAHELSLPAYYQVSRLAAGWSRQNEWVVFSRHPTAAVASPNAAFYLIGRARESLR